MKVLKGIFHDPDYSSNDMNGKEAIAVLFARRWFHITIADNGDYSRSHEGDIGSHPLLRIGYVELVEKEEKRGPLDEVDRDPGLQGLSKYFGQQLVSLNCQFK